MPTTIITKHGNGVPSSLEVGELALDKTESVLYSNTGSGVEKISAGKILNSFTVQGTTFDGSSAESVSFTAGTGIDISGTSVSNTAPDQIVTLTGSGSTSVSGTYPNFTVTSTDTVYSLPLAANGTRGGAEIGYSTNGKNYAVQLSGEKMYVNVPWTDNNTTYSAGNGLSLSGTQFKMSGSYTGTFTATGDVVAYSDAALKDDINPITEALEKVEQLTGYTFKRKGEEKVSTGVMAQEVQKVLPEAVHDNEGTLGVAYGNMVGLLIEAVKELSVKVESLESRL